MIKSLFYSLIPEAEVFKQVVDRSCRSVRPLEFEKKTKLNFPLEIRVKVHPLLLLLMLFMLLTSELIIVIKSTTCFLSCALR
jgi:hypothetical protein